MHAASLCLDSVLVLFLAPPRMVKQEWLAPSSGDARRTGLVVHNSLTRRRDPFVPQQGNRVGMYICGPTVYDSAHIGHARCYVTFDVIRRILESHFQYNVHYVMNVTDIDDKIILRARRGFLLAAYATETADDIAKIVADVTTHALPKYEARAAALEADDPKRAMMEAAAKEMRAAVESPPAPAAEGGTAADALREACADALAAWLDAERGATVTDHSIFASLPRKYELEFFDDLRALGVKLPDAITRVSEYVPEVVAYVEKIIDNGHAYESNGSVYFDTRHFDETHQYAKLAPEHVSNATMRAEGEGALAGAGGGGSGGGGGGSEKRCPNDFALWKRSKDGEPAWDSPWGPGRPGWHIECSAMACDRLPGAPFDIHAGGVDLKFPHHDNEIAQAEAYYDCAQWVNYFLHAGHVHIEGLKMSKSLKNFVTIGAARAHFTPRQLRMFFLSYAWDAPMDYGIDGMNAAIDREARFNEFFHAARETVREAREEEEAALAAGTSGSTGASSSSAAGPAGGHLQHWTEREVELNATLNACKDAVNTAFESNFDYPRAMSELQALVAACNRYMADRTVRRCGHVVRSAAASVMGGGGV
jgi:cysteinyl-tRNA synthetase